MIQLLKKTWCAIYHGPEWFYKRHDLYTLVFCRKCGCWWKVDRTQG